MRLGIGKPLLAGFGLGLGVFVMLGIVSYRSEGLFAETAAWVQHTHEVLARIQKVNADLIGVQSAVGGFVITGREDFLAPYRELLPVLQDDERTLRRLTADNPSQQARLTTLEGIIRQRLAFADETLGLQRRSGLPAAAALISTGRGQESMKRFALVIGALLREEQDLLIRREARARSQTTKTFFILSVGTVIGIGLLLAVLFLFNSEAAERRGAEAASRLAAEIVRATDDAVITKTLQGVITSWNPAAERIFGYTPQEAVGRPVMMFIPPECAEEENRILADIRRGERVEHFETVRLRKDGRRANVSVTVSPLSDNTGRIVGAAKTLRDITGRKQAEEALRVSEDRFRTMANAIPQLAWTARADGSIEWYNQRWYEYTGTTLEQMQGWGWQTVHHSETLPKVLEKWTGAIQSGEPFEMEFPLRGADGTFRNFLTRVNPLKDGEGRVVQWFGTNTDVDELKQMEKSLRASQARLNSTLAAGSIGTWTWDIVNDRLSADEFTARMFSIEPDAAAKGLPVEVYLRAVLEEDQPVVANRLGGAIKSCSYYDVEYRVRQRDGELRWLQAKGRVEGDSAGNALYFHGAVMDITERKRTEGRFRRLVDSNAQGVMFWNMKGEIVGANDAFLRIVGYTREDQDAGRIGWAAMTPPEYAHLDRRSLEELAANGICTPFEKEYIRKDGSRVPILLGAAIFEDSPDEGVCFLIDITERKRTDQALRESEERFRFLNDLSEATRSLVDPEQIMAVTARMLGGYLHASRCAYADVGQDGEDVTTLYDYTDGCASVVGTYQLSLFGARAAATLRGGQTLIIRDLQAEILPGEGAEMFNAIGIRAMIGCPLVKNGGLRAIMAIHQTTPREWKPGEITLVQDVADRCWATIERRTAEENTRQLNAELEQRVVERTAQLEDANRAKSTFLSTMSHEIRTPMNAILGYSQLMLRDPALGMDAKANLRIINRSGEHLLTLINDVLDMSKIEAGRTELNPATFRLAGLVDDVAAMSRLRAKAKALQFEVFFDRESEPCVVADEGKIRQVLINLLANAIKFTQSGEIKLHIALEPRSDKRLWLSARVEDTGPGISDRQQERLFEPFSRAELGINSQEGTGLGLAIARKHARLMGGDVTVISTLGSGSIFTFEIPVAPGVTELAVRRAVSRRVIGICAGAERPGILIVDDQIDNRDWLAKLLTVVGFSVRVADNGQAAIRTWEEWRPQMILMDVQMPVMDGLEATRRIKADPRGSGTVIIVLSASAMNEERRIVLESGADGFLPKPCREDDLLETMRVFLKIAYDYDETDVAEPGLVTGLPVLSAERLGQLPREVLEELRDATLNGNKKLLNDLILKLRKDNDAACADGVQELTNKYQYQSLAQLLEEACNV
jgi:two-component system sensor histidine kinase/response regulator